MTAATTKDVKASIRWFLPIGLLVFEILSISLSFDSLRRPEDSQGAVLTILNFASDISKFGLVFLGALIIISFERWPVHRQSLADFTATTTFLSLKLIFHLLVFAVFYVFSGLLFSIPSPLSGEQRQMMVLPWLIAGITTILSLGWSIAPLSFWQKIFQVEKASLLLAFIAGAATWLFAYFSRNLWETLGDTTLQLVHQILLLFFDSVFVDVEQRLLGIGEFIVEVGQPCSGYEGIGMVSVFTSLYLYMFRNELRFPNALMLFPIGILTIWVFNFLRISVLIVIGAEISPEMAINGFHSQAGWISFLLVCMGLFYLAHRISFFSKANKDAQPATVPLKENLGASTLIPLAAVFLATLIAGAFSTQPAINWSYPIPVAAGAAALLYCWPVYQLGLPKVDLQSIGVGVLVFILWILLVPANPELDSEMRSLLVESSTTSSVAWIAVRVLGSVLIIPIIEELVFRGYLLCRLAGQKLSLQGPLTFSWIALIVSSVIFGLLHQAWLAGIVAGAAYAWVRYRSTSLWCAIVAHSITNLLLAVYVLSTGTWSLW
ncbi:MAG: exosortase E/protease, VPEID-CTERM system [Pseudomonadales bacterium]|jgi:exosortase E/protease (VPEID-CTERM system)|nr:exosortase E/protease, VPEID-CTERM system [Pseudomonadales bacterium]